jgi:hypothetical protein
MAAHHIPCPHQLKRSCFSLLAVVHPREAHAITFELPHRRASSYPSHPGLYESSHHEDPPRSEPTPSSSTSEATSPVPAASSHGVTPPPRRRASTDCRKPHRPLRCHPHPLFHPIGTHSPLSNAPDPSSPLARRIGRPSPPALPRSKAPLLFRQWATSPS